MPSSQAELKDRQEFLAENTLRSQMRSITPEMWDRLGVDIHELLPFIHEAAHKVGVQPAAKLPAGVLLQARPERPQARPARCQPGLLAAPLG